MYIYQAPVDETVLKPLPIDAHKELIEDLNYNGEVKEEKKEVEKEPEKEKENRESWFDEFFDFDIGPINLGPVGNIIVLLLLAIGLGWFIYNFLETPPAYRSKAEREVAKVDISEIQEEKLTLIETESLLDRAVRNEQYELAIRLQYLALLKRLHEKKMIKFAKDKVNLHYLREMERLPQLSAPFRRITHNFERNWYGQYPIDRLTYRLVADTYTDFHAKLDNYRKTSSNV